MSKIVGDERRMVRIVPYIPLFLMSVTLPLNARLPELLEFFFRCG